MNKPLLFTAVAVVIGLYLALCDGMSVHDVRIAFAECEAGGGTPSAVVVDGRVERVVCKLTNASGRIYFQQWRD